jgi:hypothetical protein
MSKMSELSTAGVGVDLQRLTGQANYTQWTRDFKVVADLKGEENVLTKA